MHPKMQTRTRKFNTKYTAFSPSSEDGNNNGRALCNKEAIPGLVATQEWDLEVSGRKRDNDLRREKDRDRRKIFLAKGNERKESENYVLKDKELIRIRSELMHHDGWQELCLAINSYQSFDDYENHSNFKAKGSLRTLIKLAFLDPQARGWMRTQFGLREQGARVSVAVVQPTAPTLTWKVVRGVLEHIRDDGKDICDFLDRLAQANKWFDSFSEFFTPQMVMGLIQLSRHATSPVDAALAVGQILNSANRTGHLVFSFDWAEYFKDSELPNVFNIRPQAGEHAYRKVKFDGVSDQSFLLKFFNRFKTSPLKYKMIVFFGAFVNSALFSSFPGTAQVVVQSIANVLTDWTWNIDVMGKAIELLSMIAERWNIYWKTGDILQFFGKPYEVEAADEILKMVKKLMDISLSKGGNDPLSVLAEAKLMLEKYSLLESKNDVLRGRLIHLHGLVTAAETNMNNSRPMPFCMIISGDPGIGKTVLTDYFEVIERRKNNLPDDVAVSVVFDPEAKFQYRPTFAKIVIMNDAFQLKDEHTTSSTIAWMQAIADTKVFRLNLASLEEKSMASISPDWGFVTTNMEQYLMSKSTGGAYKMDRRWPVLIMKWTDKAIANSDYLGYPLSESGDHTDGKTFDELGWIEYKFYRMRNDKSNRMVFGAANMVLIRSFKTADEVVDYCYQEAELKRAKRAKFVEGMNTRRYCPDCFMTLPHVDGSRCKKAERIPSGVKAKVLAELKTHPLLLKDPPDSLPGTIVVRGQAGRKPTWKEYMWSWAFSPFMAYARYRDGNMTIGDISMFLSVIIYGPIQSFLAVRRLRAGGSKLFELISVCGALVYFWWLHKSEEGVNYEEFAPTSTVELREAREGEFGVGVDADGPAPRPEEESPPTEMGFTPFKTFQRFKEGRILVWDEKNKAYNWGEPITVPTGTKLAALMVVMAAVPLCYRMWVRPQATVSGEVKGVPTAHTPQRVTQHVNLPWMSGTLQVDLKLTVGELAVHGLLLRGGIVVTNGHLFKGECNFDPPSQLVWELPLGFTSRRVKQGTKLRVTAGLVESTVVLTENCVYFKPGSDLAFLHLNFLPGSVTLVDEFLLHEPFVSTGFKVDVRGDIYEGCHSVATYIAFPNAKTLDGDCGLPVRLENGYIIGIHRGTNEDSRIGVGAPLCRKFVEEAKAELTNRGVLLVKETDSLFGGLNLKSNVAHQSSDYAWVAKTSSAESQQVADLIPLGNVGPRNDQTMTGRKTKLYEHFAQDLEHEYVAPNPGKAAKLANGEWVSAVTRKFANAAVPRVEDRPALEAAMEDFVAGIPPLSKCSDITRLDKLCPMTMYQSICGDPRNMFMNGRDAEKGVGYLLSSNKITKKDAMKELEKGLWDPHPMLLQHIHFIEEAIEGAEPETVLYFAVATVKDEMYPEPKVVNEGKVRLFYVCDLAYNLVLRRYLLPISSYLAEIPGMSGAFMTMNPGSVQWEMLGKHLSFGELPKGDAMPSILELDHKSFDDRHAVMRYYYSETLRRVALKLGYTPVDAKRLSVLLWMGFRYLLVMEGNVFLANSKLVSGRADTMFCNIIIQVLAIATIWRQTMHCSYRDHLALACTGDDSLIGMRGVYPPFIEQFTERMRDLGYTVTDASKKGYVSPKKLSEVTYLKRGFRVVEYPSLGFKFLSSPLELTSIFKALCYRVGKKRALSLDDEVDLLNLRVASRELFLHGEDVFERFKARCVSLGFRAAFPTSAELVDDYKRGCFRCWDPREGEMAMLEKYKGVDELPRSNPEVSSRWSRLSTPSVEQDHQSFSFGNFGSYSTPVTEQSRREIDGSGSLGTNPSAELNNDVVTTDVISKDPAVKIGGVHMDTEDLGRHERGFRPKNPDMGLTEFLSIPRRITTIDSSALAAYDPFAVWASLGTVQNILNRYMLYRGRYKLTFSYTGNPSVLGMHRVFAVPNVVFQDDNVQSNSYDSLLSASGSPVTNLCRSSQFPHLDLDLSQTCTCSMTLDWVTNATFNYISNPSGWSVLMGPIVPLASVSGVTPDPINIQVYMSMVDMEFDVLRPQGKRVMAEAAKVQEMPAGPVARTLSYLRKINELIPSSVQYPLDKVLMMGQGAAIFMGYSRPVVVAEDAITMRRTGVMALASGQPDFGYPLGMDPGVNHDVSGGCLPMYEESDTNLRSIVNRWANIGLIAPATGWSAHPSMMWARGADSYYEMTPVGFVSAMFGVWTGSLEMKAVFYLSPLVRARVGFVIVPPGFAAPLTFPVNGTYLTHIFELAGTTECVFEVPYLYPDPFQELGGLSFVSPVPLNETKVLYFLLDGPYAPSPTFTMPNALVSVRGGRDLQFAKPGLVLADRCKVTPQAGKALPPITGDSAVWHFGERIEDIKMLAKRSCLVACMDVSALDNTQFKSIKMPACGITPFDVVTNGNFPGCTFSTTQWSYANWAKMAFFSWTGGNSWKMCTFEGAVTNLQVSSFTDTPGFTLSAASSAITGGGSGTQYFGSGDFVEVVVPYRNRYLFSPCNSLTAGTVANTEVVAIIPFHNLGPAGSVNYYHSAGDDFQLGGFLAAPAVLLRS